jgi:hypothetical protein
MMIETQSRGSASPTSQALTHSGEEDAMSDMRNLWTNNPEYFDVTPSTRVESALRMQRALAAEESLHVGRTVSAQTRKAMDEIRTAIERHEAAMTEEEARQYLMLLAR